MSFLCQQTMTNNVGASVVQLLVLTGIFTITCDTLSASSEFSGSKCYARNQKLLLQRYNQLTDVEKEERQVYAVSLGTSVTYSSATDNGNHYLLDYNLNVPYGWVSSKSTLGEWIQVNVEDPQLWTGVIIQGRGDFINGHKTWVEEVKISYSLNGKTWEYVDNGTVFKANQNTNQHVRINFTSPVFARTIRIYPQSWHQYIGLRFEAIYSNLE